MDDNDVCPLCCEELDMSDRQFFPCKCGYQVCMWCWHRIRESESGLCPACRTPYGDDPHEFSAVDMEEVVKANKEKAAAEKRERERLRQQQGQGNGSSSGVISSASSVGSASSGHFSSGGFGSCILVDDPSMSSGPSSGYSYGKPLDPPKDRNQLANMRVIRRNLVYAVGLPPPNATEDTLRKPEYFGQYGKVSKIVLNRNHNGNGDPRRASASAYVTFAHKEDALACILALDGFYLDGRNIRASYGTSKYCSAFIKSVRCNNPDCTYLHGMGDTDDTFTKQEIQAGYVTSGRDVLARQQQQMAAQQQTGSRRRVGGGGPSGTGKVPGNPVFPPPCYDEPTKPERRASYGVSGITRSVSSSAAFSSVTGGDTVKLSRSSSASASSNQAPSAAEKLSKQQEQLRRLHPQNKISTSTTPKKNPSTSDNASANSVGTVATAAAVVAGGSNSGSSASHSIPPHSTLTSLTPLKRTSSTSSTSKDKNSITGKNNIPGKTIAGVTSGSQSSSSLRSTGDINNVQLPPNLPVPVGMTPSAQAALLEKRRESLAATAKQQQESLMAMRNNGNNQTLAPGFKNTDLTTENNFIGGSVLGGIGSSNGTVIGPNSKGINSITVGGSFTGGSLPISMPESNGVFNSTLSIGPGGPRNREDRNSDNNRSRMVNRFNMENSSSGTFLGKERWAENDAPGLSSSFTGGSLFGNSSFQMNRVGIWGNETSNAIGSNASSISSSNQGAPLGYHGFPSGNSSMPPVGSSNRQTNLHENTNNQIGNSAIGGGNLLSKNPFGLETGSSALASMLGIDLPTGSGSLRETNLTVGPGGGNNGHVQNPNGIGGLRSAPFPGHGAPGQDSIWDNSQKQTSDSSNYLHANNYRVNATIASSQGAIGSPGRRPMSKGNVGGLPIGGGSGPVGGYRSNLSGNGSNSSDIALLQSLLPGVHITSGNAHQPAAPMLNPAAGPIGWNAGSSGMPTPNSQNNVIGRRISGANDDRQQSGNTDTWGSAPGLYNGNPNVQMSTRSSIW